MLRPSAPATVPSAAQWIAERHDGFPLTWALYQSLITGFPVVILRRPRAHRRRRSGRHGRGLQRPIGPRQDDVGDERLMGEDLREQLNATSSSSAFTAGCCPAAAAIASRFSMYCSRAADAPSPTLRKSARPRASAPAGAIGRPEDSGDQGNEERADRRRQLTADRLTLEEFHALSAILAQEQRVGDARFSSWKPHAADNCHVPHGEPSGRGS